jgi:DNA polymerase ligase (LigD)-like protein
MPRFVLLYHDCPAENPRSLHFDLMLEAAGALRTWAIRELPRSWGVTAGRVPSGCSSEGSSVLIASTNTVPAEQIPDHRLAYLDYEGPVSGGRGTVTRLDSGEYVSQKESPNQWALELTGRIIRGQVALRRTSPDAADWQLTFEIASRD